MTPPRSVHNHRKTSGITVRDVALHAGVSTATVSRVLSQKEGVSEDLEKRVRESIDALSYRPNQAARRLRERRSKIIGMLVPDIQIPFFASTVVNTERVLQEAGYLLLLGNTNDDKDSEKIHIETFLGEDVAGVIFTAADVADISNYKRLMAEGIHLVAIDRTPGDLQVDTVQVANVQATSMAVRHLIDEGHRRIGLIAGPDYISTAVERQTGYELTLKFAGIEPDQQLVQMGDYTQTGGYRAMQALLNLPERPSAVLACNNPMTLGALQAIIERDVQVPCDLAVIGFDDMPWSTILRPPLTVIAQPVNDIGIEAARLMLERIHEPDGSIKHITLETQLIVRQSCRCGNFIRFAHN